MLVPRFAVAVMAVALAAATAGIVVVRAQNEERPLWFQFAIDVKGLRSQPMSNVARAGSDDGLVVWHRGDQIFGTHFAVLAIKADSVELEIRARKYSRGDKAMYRVKEELGDLRDHRYVYTPGETVEIPVEGGGTLVLRGQIVDHQPKIAWGLTAEPGPDQLVVTHPVVIAGGAMLANLEGGSADANNRDQAVQFSAVGLGRLTIALRPFPGAVEGEANWGELKFGWQGRDYMVRTSSPITGGAQPHPVWIELDSAYPAEQGYGIGSTRLPATP